MGTVQHHKGIVLFAGLLGLIQIRCIRVHGKESLSDHQYRIFLILPSDFLQSLQHTLMVQVVKPDYVFGGRLGPFNKAIMTQLIHDDVVVLFDQARDDSIPSQPPCRVNHQAFCLPKLSQFHLQLLVIPILLDKLVLCDSHRQWTAARMNSRFLDSLDGNILGILIFGETQIICRCKVDSVKDIIMLVHRQHFSVGTCQHSTIVKPKLDRFLSLQIQAQ
jgi:hypothetical protein